MSFAPSSQSTRTVSSTVSTTPLFLRLFFFFISLHKVTFGELVITTPQDLIDFSNKVNSGTSYSETTVYLATDLNFDSSPQKIEPIGTSVSFNGTFDGQGHVIRNLNMSTHSQYVGLFGYSSSATIKNVVVDSSCSFTSSHSGPGSSPNVGSIAGYCSSCTIENVVSMASLTYVGYTTALRIGGIVGRISSPSTVRNCVNYGTVTQSGNVTYTGSSSSSYVCTYIGGIVGFCAGSSTNSIQNCANYGTLTHSGASYNLSIGGISGISYYGNNNKIENCVSAGKIINTTQGNESNYIGSVVGYANYYSSQTTPSTVTTIMHCLWMSDVGCNEMCGGKHESATVAVTNSTLSLLNTTAMDELNEYAEENSWDKWLMLHLNGGTINNLTQDTLIVTQKRFPDPVKEGSVFSFWCMDVECTGVYDPNATDNIFITNLYAGWNVYAVTFDFGNGTTKTKNVFYGEKYGTLPDAGERTGWTFIGWFTSDDGSGDEITSESTVSIADDHVLHAHWTINYALRFIFNNGESDVVKVLNYGEGISYPNNPTREGYSFDGWSENTTTMPAHNLIITAQWTINNYTLRFILNNGESDIVKTLNYSDPIDYPKNLVKEGYSFSGWSENITTMPAHNLNVTAQWTKVTEYVEVVFAKRDLSEDDVKAIIRKYANDDNFVIANIETVNGETKVIIEFVDAGKAQNFVETINTSSDPKNNLIKKVSFISNEDDSYSVSLFPKLFNGLFI